MSPESLQVISQEKYLRVMSVQYVIEAYAEFTAAQNLGVVFGPKDLKIDLFKYFVVIRNKVNEVLGGQ